MGFFTDGKLTAYGQKFARMVNDVKSKKCLIGFSGEYENGLPVTQVAVWNEFGTINAPARPFIRQSVKRGKPEVILKTTMEFGKQMLGSCNGEAVLRASGECMKDNVVKEIERGNFVPNAPATIAKKGSDKPLIDTGQMKNSVIYAIVSK